MGSVKRTAAAAMTAAISALALPAAGAHAATKTFGYTGQEQTFIVPARVSHLQVFATGAHGAGFGGAGAVVSGPLTVTPGQTLYVEVGGAGVFVDPSRSAFNGGGIGGSVPGPGEDGGNGGGASDVRTVSKVPSDSAASLDSRLIVAGGGGGDGTSGTASGSSGAGGGGGAAGLTGAGAGSGADGGQGAGPGGPGAGGSGNGGGPANGGSGSPGVGGYGGSSSGIAGGGGGGGGGVYGGGGGGGDQGGNGGGAGGGGGSSLVPAGGSSSFAAPGQDAQVQITSQIPPPPKPDTKITKAKIRKKKHRATFSFKAIGSASGFDCKLVKANRKKNPGFSACTSPKAYKKLKPGSYTFEVRARNAQGPDATPAKRSFTIPAPKV